MVETKRYKILSKHPNDEFIDLQVGVKLDSHQVVRFLNESYNYIEELRKENRKLTEELDKYKETVQELLETGKKMYGMLLNEHLYNKTNINDVKNTSQLVEQEKEHLKFMRTMFSFKELLEEKGEKYSNSQKQITIRELEKLKDVFKVKATIDIYKGIVEVINEQIENLKGE